MSISYDDNHYTTGTSKHIVMTLLTWAQWYFECFDLAVTDQTIYIQKMSTTVVNVLRWSYFRSGGARGVMVIIVGNGQDDTSSNPGQDWLHFT